MKLSNASIFRRHARAEDTMLRGSMPATAAAELAPLANDNVRRVLAAAGETRLVAPLRVSIADRTAVAGAL